MTAAPILPPDGQPLTPDDVGRTRNRALSLADKGYHVFPVLVVVDPVTGANTKTYVTGRKDSPVGAKWNATRDPELIRSWWSAGSRFAGCMIGIATEPSGVVLIDLDTHAQDDGTRQDGIGEWARLHLEPYPIPAAVGRSSSGGQHLPFGANPKRPVRTTAGEIAPAVDSRGIGGMFICWAPWLPKVSELPMVPDVVPDSVPWIAPKDREIRQYPSTAMAPSGDAAERVCYHRDVIAAARDGYGIPTASRQAFLAGQHVGAGQVDGQWAADTLLSALVDWTWRKPEDEAKVRDQILKGIADGARQPRPWLSETPLATVSQLPMAPVPTAMPPQRPQVPLQATGPLQAEVSPATAPAEAPWTGGAARYDDDDDEDDEGVPAPHLGRHVVLTSLSSIPIRRARWLWDGRIPAGAISLVAGKQGLGKSTLVYELVAQMTRGELPGEFAGTPRAALICATEDDWSCTIAPRLVASGVDPALVFRVEAVRADGIADGLVLPADVSAVERAALEVGAAMLVLDPLTSRLDSSLDGHKDGPVRQALEPLAAMAGRTGLALVGLMHLNKGAKSDPMDAVMGATAFTAVARSVLIVMRDPDDEERRRKFVGLAKNNLGDIDLPTLVFRTVTALVPTDEEGDDRPAEVGRIEWLGQAEGSIADAMESAGQDEETRTGIADSMRWLREHLTACGGEADAMSIKDAARKAGFNERMISRAKKRAGVVAATIPGSFPRRTSWSLKGRQPLQADMTPIWGAATRPTLQRTQSSLAKNTVSSDSCVSTRTDGTDGADGFDGPDEAVRTADTGVSPSGVSPGTPGGVSGPQMAGQAPPWAVEPELSVADGPLPCPCGRPETHHSRGCWRICPAGHRWHAFGRGALEDCPHCPMADDLPDGGDAA